MIDFDRDINQTKFRNSTKFPENNTRYAYIVVSTNYRQPLFNLGLLEVANSCNRISETVLSIFDWGERFTYTMLGQRIASLDYSSRD